MSALAVFSQDAGKMIYASVYSTNEWKEWGDTYSETGIYSFPLDSYSRTLVKEDVDLDASGGGTMTEDFYFCTKEMNYGAWADVTHFTFKPDTWEYNSQLFGATKGVATDLAYDHTTAKIFGCFSTDPDLNEPAGGFVFGTIDEGTGNRYAIKAIDTPWIALGCDRSGQLYAVDMAGNFLKVDKINGSTETLANLGVTASRRSTGAVDTATGTFYVVVTNEDNSTVDQLGYSLTESKLYAIDLATSTSKMVYEFADGEALGGMYIPGPLADDNAPAAATELTPTFAPGALNGTLSFTMPDKTFGGAALSGDIEYLIRANGSLFAKGSAAAGADVNAAGKVDSDGEYEFVLELTNAAGRAPKTKLAMWVGHDTPVKIASASLTYGDGMFRITWAHPSATEHGGYMDPALLSYDVTRLPDNVKTHSGINDTDITDPVEMPASMIGYSYRIDMSYRGKPVSSFTTDTYNLGTVALPYTLDFEDDNSFDQLTIIDVNGDRNEWYREYAWYIEALGLECAAAVYPYSSTKQADDWMILPAIAFEAGTTYTVEFQVSTMSDSYAERLAVYFGTAPKPEAMTGTLLAAKNYAIYDPVDEKLTFSPAASGQYYIGFHACSDPDRAGLGIRNIKIDRDANSGIGNIEAADPDATVIEVYNLQGVKVDLDARAGIYIERRADGSTVKVRRN